MPDRLAEMRALLATDARLAELYREAWPMLGFPADLAAHQQRLLRSAPDLLAWCVGEIGRLEGALRTIRDQLPEWYICGRHECEACGAYVWTGAGCKPDCPVPGIEALMVALGPTP